MCIIVNIKLASIMGALNRTMDPICIHCFEHLKYNGDLSKLTNQEKSGISEKLKTSLLHTISIIRE